MHLLCHLQDLEATGAKSVELQLGQRRLLVAVVKTGDGVVAYLDRCPHAGTPLEWQEDRFFDASGQYLQCATHGALFQPHDGKCIDGPCFGDSLTALPITCIDQQVFLRAQDSVS